MTYIEHQNSVEDPANSLSDVASGAFGLRCSARTGLSILRRFNFKGPSLDSHSYEFHSLERESGLDEHREHGQESVGSDMVRDESGARNGTRIFPILR